MRGHPRLVLIGALLLGGSFTPAIGQQSVPSCYAAARLPVAVPRATRSVFLFVDQTTPFNEDLRRTIRTGMQELLAPGTSFTIATFSSLSQNHHTRVLSSGTIETPVPARARPSLPVNKLGALDRCLLRQRRYAVELATRGVATATGAPAAAFSRSELMASLSHLSHAVRTAPAGERIVIVASDLLEHSTAASFYHKRGLRLIAPRTELQNATRLGLIGNFGRARIYVVGTAAIPPGPGESERDVRAMNALVAFWSQWFQRSNSSEAVIGRPNLVAPIR